MHAFYEIQSTSIVLTLATLFPRNRHFLLYSCRDLWVSFYNEIILVFYEILNCFESFKTHEFLSCCVIQPCVVRFCLLTCKTRKIKLILSFHSNHKEESERKNRGTSAYSLLNMCVIIILILTLQVTNLTQER